MVSGRQLPVAFWPPSGNFGAPLMSKNETIPQILRARIETALAATSKGADLPENFAVEVTATADPKFGDYQANAAMVLAKRPAHESAATRG